jgi:hypothetical protein
MASGSKSLALGEGLIPKVDLIEGVHIVRDDLFPGGTKARFAGHYFNGSNEVVYASPCEGGAQTALATVGRSLGKSVTIFCAKRQEPHPRSLMAKALGAQVIQVTPGHLTVVQARARSYARDMGAKLLPFGLDGELAIQSIADAAAKVDLVALGIEEVWCAAGSGVLARGLALAYHHLWIKRFAVQVGREVNASDVAGAQVIVAPWKFGEEGPIAPFPSDRHYDAKAWAMLRRHAKGRALFWNVAAPAGAIALPSGD